MYVVLKNDGKKYLTKLISENLIVNLYYPIVIKFLINRYRNCKMSDLVDYDFMSTFPPSEEFTH